MRCLVVSFTYSLNSYVRTSSIFYTFIIKVNYPAEQRRNSIGRSLGKFLVHWIVLSFGLVRLRHVMIC